MNTVAYGYYHPISFHQCDSLTIKAIPLIIYGQNNMQRFKSFSSVDFLFTVKYIFTIAEIYDY